MKKIDLRGLQPLEPRHLVKTERGLVVGCSEMDYRKDDLYQCTDFSCGIVYRHLQFVGYAIGELETDTQRMWPPQVDHAPMKCKSRCALLKRNADCNFICALCGGYWYMNPGQKFLVDLEDLYVQDLRVIKFLIGKLHDATVRMRRVDAIQLSNWWGANYSLLYGNAGTATQLKTAFIRKLDRILGGLLERYRI